MKVAKETVWETKDGKLCAAGDPDAAYLVAGAGLPVAEKKLAKFDPKDVAKYFKGPNEEKEKKPADVTKTDTESPAPKNREDDQKITKRVAFQMPKGKKK